MATVSDLLSSVCADSQSEDSFSKTIRVHHQVGGRSYVVTRDLIAKHPLFSANRTWNLGSWNVIESNFDAFAKTGAVPHAADSSISDDLVIRALKQASALPLPLALQSKPKVVSSTAKELSARVQVHHQPVIKSFGLRTTETARHPSLPAPVTIVRQERPFSEEEFPKLLADPSPSQEDFDKEAQALLLQSSIYDVDAEIENALAAAPPSRDIDAEFQKALEQPTPVSSNPPSDKSFDIVSWVLESGLWDGNPVAWKDAADFQTNLEQKLATLLTTGDPQSYQYQRLVAGLAYAGVQFDGRESLAKELQALGLSPQGAFMQARFWSSIGKFCSKYKTEILIGIAVVAVVTVIVVVAVTTGGAASGAAAAGGGALIDGLNDKLEKEPSKVEEPLPAVEEAPPNPLPPELESPPKLEMTLEIEQGKPIYLENGVFLDGEFFTYTELLTRINLEQALVGKDEPFRKSPAIEITGSPPPGLRDPSLHQRFFEAIGRGVMADLSSDPELRPNLSQETSRSFKTAGIRHPHLRIGGINGMNNSFNETCNNATYIREFTPNQSIEWVYNHSNGPVADLIEIGGVNLFGYSPHTAQLLVDHWTAFHLENKDRPNAKYLHICHSQGGFHTKNALASCPKEVRDRIIVVNVGAATFISKKECFQATNYASRTDFIKFAELGWFGAWDSTEVGLSARFEQILNEREGIVLLPPHPDQIGMGHGFQDPTLKDRIKDHIDEYLLNDGEYL